MEREKADPLNTIYFTAKPDLEGVEDILKNTIEESNIPIIREIASHVVFSGGKRIRPILSILSARICAEPPKNILFLAAAIELIHTASLIHDDVLDGAGLRRGRPTAHAKWGNHISILVGDFCFGLASKLLAEKTNSEIISIVSDAIRQTTEGEIMEVVYNNNTSINISDYMNIIELKTARLISATCESAGRLTEAPPRLCVALREYGLNLGIAFQIIDDILDYTTNGDRLGKTRGTDLREGKLTLPVIYTLKKCDPGEREMIKESLLSKVYSDKLFESILLTINKYNSIEDSKKSAEEYIIKAKEALEPFKTSFGRDTLLQFADYIGARTY